MFLLTLTVVAVASAGSVTGHGRGGNIPSGAPAEKSGVFVSDAVITSSGVVAAGNAVTVILKGLQHDWCGDLIASVAYIDADGNLVRSANLFYRIGQSDERPEGAWASFGAPGPTGDNYEFNSGFETDIWSVAARSGFADFLPGKQTDALTHGRYFPTDAGAVRNDFSSAFAGMPAGGMWRLTITDASDHASQGGTLGNIGSLTGWEIRIQTDN